MSNDKCLECHKEIDSRIDRRSGFHASREVKGKECISCHSEHHGRNFDMVRFDEDAFNHDLTGYELTGEHDKIDCRKCHIPDFISDRELKARRDTYLGLDQECLTCHDDYHQNTLPKDCASCHNTEAFAPAANFDHDDAEFHLAGKHQDVDCIECHKMEVRGGEDFQKFTGIAFNTCKDCHSDVHESNLGNYCSECHTEQGFTLFKGMGRFKHDQRTVFPLKGKHKDVNCAKCHNMDLDVLEIFQDRLGVPTSNCVVCHEDPHEDKFGQLCKECHNESSWRIRGAMDNFNHDRTGFKLVGKHQAVDCKECHKGRLLDPLPHNACADCHSDYHEGVFVTNGVSPDCASCHIEDGFDVSIYTIEQHNEAAFPLEGAHLATPCFFCHQQDDKWSFRDIGERCIDCHIDEHEGFLDEKFYPNKSCDNCHISASWQENHFDHSLTDFELLGAHAKENCTSCHISVNSSVLGQEGDYFSNLSGECISCHENVHDDQFEENGQTDCLKCHVFDAWSPSVFDHDTAAFPLEGKHAEVACNACHKPIQINDEIIVQYKFESFECVVCHQ